MAQVIIALGSNLNNPLAQLIEAKAFLSGISETDIIASPIYQSEPVGPSENDFLNAVISISTSLKPDLLLEQLKGQEKKQGRPTRYPKWTARTLDLDIIAYNRLVVETDNLIIPHANYVQRLFVLLPLKDVLPNWEDPKSAQHIDQLITLAPEIRISKTSLDW
ncbi:MAG: 2-amino-4-hydroxy-6-hydroxymethyldihydropteridine diphosphokinase [Balneolaceae bacterium]